MIYQSEGKGLPHVSPDAVVSLFASEIAVTTVDKQQTTIEKLYSMFEVSADAEISGTFRNATAEEKAKGLKAPLIQSFLNAKCSLETARVKASNLQTLAKAWMPDVVTDGRRWTPKGYIIGGKLQPFEKGEVSGFYAIVKAARDELKARREIRSEAKADDRFAVEFAKQQQKVAKEHGVALKDITPDMLEEAREVVAEKLDSETRAKKMQSVVDGVVKAVGFEGIADVIAALQEAYAAHLQEEQEAAEAKAANEEAKAAEIESAAHHAEREAA